jgi:hypothetical protein
MSYVFAALTAAWAWTLAHPALSWPLISAIVTIALKPRSPAQYAAMAAMWPAWFWSRFAPLLQLVGALGLDPVKALQVIGKVFTGKQDSAGRPPMGGLVVVLAIGLAVGTGGCALFTPANLPETILTGKQIACIIERAFVDDATLNTVCDLLTPAQRAAAKQVAAAHREQLAKRMSAMRAETCSDAGVK